MVTFGKAFKIYGTCTWIELSRYTEFLWIFLVFWFAAVVFRFEEIETGVAAGKLLEIDEPRSTDLR